MFQVTRFIVNLYLISDFSVEALTLPTWLAKRIEEKLKRQQLARIDSFHHCH
uniref:Uncharacterized protein n=1 Tax=Setaria italica TaxID=4555 RepID=K3ZKZ2_SETIT